VAGALAQAGQHAQAATLAAQAELTGRAITNPELQASTLTAVAWALAQAGRQDRARRVAVAVCQLGDFAAAVGAVVGVDASVGSVVVGLLLAGGRDMAASPSG
jgi:hypothetical protein